MRTSIVASPLFASNSSGLISQPGKRCFSHGMSAGLRWRERRSSKGLASFVFGLTFMALLPGRSQYYTLVGHFNIGLPHDLAEFLGLRRHELLVGRGIHWPRHDALRDELVGDRRIFKRRVDDVVETIDDGLRRAAGREHAEPVEQLVAGEPPRAFRQRRHIRRSE